MAQTADLRVRREAMQRVQIGLFGFGAVLLVVTLANLVVNNSRPDATQMTVGTDASGTGQANDTGSTGTEPLADLGVTPKSDQSSVAPSVPDLKPDPRLSKPMDQDPNRAQRRR